jgi:hypothetical protein
MDTPTLSRWPSVRLPWSHSPQAGQISPNKNMNFPRTTAAFTLSPVPGGFRPLVLTHPETEPSMRFLSVGSHFCTWASFRPLLTKLPLPSASGYIGPNEGPFRYSHRGLSPHQFMPMSGVHIAMQRKTPFGSFPGSARVCNFVASVGLREGRVRLT